MKRSRAALCTLALLALAARARPQDGDAPAWRPQVAEASDEWRGALSVMTIPDGFEVDLWAAEPLLANPVCLYVADDGAVYVGETFRHFEGVTGIRKHWDWLDADLAARTVEDRIAYIRRFEGEGFADYSKAYDRIRLLRDTDGDGQADRQTSFADGFQAPESGIGAGVLADGGVVYYTNVPDLWRLTDTDGDDVADRREVMHTGFGVHTGLLGHDLHGLRIGPDRRLYFSIGDRGFSVQADGRTIDHSHTGAVLSCELDGSGLRVVHTGLRNPQELVFDDFGRLFTGDNNSDGGDQARWVEILPHADSAWRFSYQWLEEPRSRGPWNAERLWEPKHEHQAAWHLPPIANIANGPSGLASYPGTGFGEDWRGHFFLCDFLGGTKWSGIHTFTVAPDGAGFTMEGATRFLWDVLVTDADFGPDGALYVSDWVSGWNKTGKGRVWVLRAEGAERDPHVRQTRHLLARGMGGRPVEELGLLLGHGDRRVRQAAQFALVDAGPDGVDALAAAARGGRDVLVRLHGVWGLWVAARRDPSRIDIVRGLTADPDPMIREQAWRVLGDLSASMPPAHLAAALSDVAPRVRLFAALALASAGARADGAVRAGLMTQLADAARDDDPTLRHGAVTALAACLDDEELVALCDSPLQPLRQGAALALRRRRSPALAEALPALVAADDPWSALEVVRAIHDESIDGARPALAAQLDRSGALYARVIEDDELSQSMFLRRMLAANVAEGTRTAAFRVAGLALDGRVDDAIRVEALEALTSWGSPPPRDLVMGDWRPFEPRDTSALPQVASRIANDRIAQSPAVVRRSFLDLLAVAGAEPHRELLEAWLTDTVAPGLVRARCLELLADIGAPGADERLAAALSSNDGALRAAALPLLQRLSPERAARFLPTILASGETAERRVAYELLTTDGMDPAVASRHLDAELARLDAGLLSPELHLDLVMAAERSGRAGELEARHAVARGLEPTLAPWLDSLFGGDPDAGREVFGRTELSCRRCHDVDPGSGQRVGPELTGVAARRTRLQLLTSIVEPNRSLAPGYESTNLWLSDGSLLTGRVLDESAGVIELLDADGVVHEVAADDVTDRRTGLSAMPEQLHAALDRREMRDLLAYLNTL